MIVHAFFISFVFSVLIPMILIPFFPEVLYYKDLEEGLGLNSYIYIFSLFIVFYILMYFFRKDEVQFIFDSKKESDYNINLAFLLIFILYMSRCMFFIFIGDSPYTLAVDNGTMDINGVLNKIINYTYIEISRLYPLVQGLIILSLTRKQSIFFFSLELLYGGIIFSKTLIFINIILIVFLFINSRDIWHKKNGIFILILSGVFSVILLFLLREIFGQLRTGDFSLDNIHVYSIITDGISRIQAVLSVFYAERILDDWLYGKTFCHIVGNIVPDSLIALPLHCRNIDEPIVMHYYGLSDVRLIEKDMLILWGEPFANFGLYAPLVFILVIGLFRIFRDSLGRNKYGLVFSWVVFINIMLAHMSMSFSIGNISISFFILWLLSKMEKYNYE